MSSQYKVLCRVQTIRGYIKAAVFLQSNLRQGIMTPIYEVYVNQKGGEWITRKLDIQGKELGWSKAMVCNLDLYPYWNCWKQNYINRDGIDTLNRIKLEKDNGERGLLRLCRWQKEQLANRIRQRERKEQAPWDADMKLVPKEPRSFREWMRREACKEVFIFYQYAKNGAKEGYCARCRKYVPIREPKHGKETTCPSCKAKAVYKAVGRSKNLRTETYSAELMQRFHGGIVIRHFVQYQRYAGEKPETPGIITREEIRTLLFNTGEVRDYYYGNYKNKYTRWVPGKIYTGAQGTKLYRRNLSKVRSAELLKHSTVELWEELPIQTREYLKLEKRNPEIEMLAKLGMYRLARELIGIGTSKSFVKQDETELAKRLRIDKSRMGRLKAMDGGIITLQWLQQEKLADTIWQDEMIREFEDAVITVNRLGFLPPPISYHKAYHYLKRQAALADETLSQTVTTWRDYINMAEQLKMDTKLEMLQRPKNLREAHNRVIEMNKAKSIEKKAKEIERKWPKVNRQLAKLGKYEYEQGKYCVVAPKKVYDIVREGMILGHCVHTCDYYFSRIQTDESYLFFLRKKETPDVPWYTLEVEPSGNIRQKRTTGDKQNPDFAEAIPFLKKWQRYYQQQLTDKEKVLGEKADLLRREGYQKLRRDGNRIWHGPLAGKLLADVLEQDFMEADYDEHN